MQLLDPCYRPAVNALDQTDASSEQLVARARSGCQESVERLVARYEKRIFHFLVQMIGNVHTAEDLTQDTFVRAYRNLDRFDARYRFSTWLFTLAKRTAIDWMRKQKRSLPESELNPETAPDLNARAEPIADRDPGRECQRNDEIDFVWERARSLGAKPFEALWLRYHEDFSINEIADIMKLNGVHVKVLLHRARGRLAKMMENMK